MILQCYVLCTRSHSGCFYQINASLLSSNIVQWIVGDEMSAVTTSFNSLSSSMNGIIFLID